MAHSTTRIRFLIVFLLVLYSPAFHNTFAQDFDDEPLEFLPGLVAKYDWSEHSVLQLDEDILFDWSQLPPISQMHPESRFSVTWTGQLQAKENGQFQLSLFACGRSKVRLGGKEVLSVESTVPQWHLSAPIELRFGYHDLQVEFTQSSAGPRVSLFWSGPTFALEPISSRYFFHRNEATLAHPGPELVDGRYAVGQALSRGLRCAACHELGSFGKSLAAPALTHLQGNLRPAWLVERLTRPLIMNEAVPSADRLANSRMPHFGMHRNDALAISAALFAASAESAAPAAIERQLQEANRRRPKKEPEIRTEADSGQGEVAFVSTGCLACHQVDELGKTGDFEQQFFGGGDLTTLAAKRTGEFVKRWLDNPAQVNADHRMPVFELSLLEQLDLAAYLSKLGADTSQHDSMAGGDAVRGMALIAAHRCGACHQLPSKLNAEVQRRSLAKTRITPQSNWDAGCLTAPDPTRNEPGFGLTDDQRQSLRHYFSTVNSQSEQLAVGALRMRESNCLACHSRDLGEGLKSQLPAIVAAVPEVAPQLAAIAPPSLTAVGDKYHEAALKAAIARQSPPLRPWLDVRMPKFRLSDADLDSVVRHLVAHDRIPDGAETAGRMPLDQLPGDAATRLAAGRLVTAEGFGCQSCHQIGDGDPPKVDLNARGTNLAMLGERVRADWFSRWVRNPARIVPRMEMPAIQTAVKGVLHDSLDTQLAALWTTLNTPDFRPPRPAPVRVVRTHNLPETNERAWLLTDVIESSSKVYLRPLVVGLPNRHNLLFDLEAGNLATWWLGDTAHQHTRGKTWYWEPGASQLGDVLGMESEGSDAKSARHPQPLEQVRLIDASGTIWTPTPLGQFAARFDHVEHIEAGIKWRGRIHLTTSQDDSLSSRWLSITQSIRAARGGIEATSECETEFSDLQPGDRIQLITAARLAEPPTTGPGGLWKADLWGNNTLLSISSPCSLTQLNPNTIVVSLPLPKAIPSPAAGTVAPAAPQGQTLHWTSTYSSPLPTDTFPRVLLPELVIKPTSINVVPGFDGVQLPLPGNEMPISFAWDKNGRFYAGSLKGRVLELLDNDEDGLAETYTVISDEIPTPFGLFAGDEGIDALAKFALIRLTPPTLDGTPHDATIVADGWGYTADYHDWAIGLERDADHNYYMALPCQQDDRSEESAYLRGSALKLIPYESAEEPRRYRIEPFAAGLRFPIGIALNSERELFTSDNQGNYNPFNELNHLRSGKRYGFINKLENKDGFSPPFESPAVNLPHPWTRSVNGMCFLHTPHGRLADAPHFGPFEGHLIGCEMNGKALVRMSLQKVGDTYQGAAYMFSRPVHEGEPNFEGPIICEVSPAGDLMVGSLQDSGWSGGQNTGSIVRLRPTGQWTLGIAEMRGTATGFEIDFTQPIDAEKGATIGNYQLRSYQRISTPAYGGDDQDERTERIESIQVAKDRRRVTIELAALREGFVYELNLSPLGSGDEDLFPSQAHYTMRSIPK